MNPNLHLQSLKLKKIHFIGIGGIGMSALARYIHIYGSVISGSDKDPSTTINELKLEGIKNIWTPHGLKNLEEVNPEYVIYSTAIDSNNEEFIWAKNKKKIILHRSELLHLLTQSKKLIAVSGTHGKTTTSAMISSMLMDNGFEPSVIIGGILLSKNANTISGKSDYFVVEADESDKSFLKGEPEIAVITNIEADHLENYPGGIEEIKESFIKFANKGILKSGLVACTEDKFTNEIILNSFNPKNPKLITYGIHTNPDTTSLTSKFNEKTKSWDINLKGKYLTSIQLKFPGEHNILNALAAFGTGLIVGISPEKIKHSLEEYSGVKRRFEIISKNKDITIIDDYAHHPTEISATIKAAKGLNLKRLIGILQPHQPTRLKDLWKDFIEALKNEEDLIFVTDIYIARGKEIKGISSEKLVKETDKPNIKYLSGDIDDITRYIEKLLKPGDLVLIMGAGDITNLGPKLLKSYEALASTSGNN